MLDIVNGGRKVKTRWISLQDSLLYQPCAFYQVKACEVIHSSEEIYLGREVRFTSSVSPLPPHLPVHTHTPENY